MIVHVFPNLTGKHGVTFVDLRVDGGSLIINQRLNEWSIVKSGELDILRVDHGEALSVE